MTYYKFILFMILSGYVIFALADGMPGTQKHFKEQFNHAIKLENQENYKQANEVFKKLHVLQPNRLDILSRLVNLNAFTLNQTKAAIDYLQQMIALRPDIARFYYQKAQLLNVLNETNASITAINQAIKLQPNNLYYLEFKFELSRKTHMLETALETAQAIVKSYPKNQVYWRYQAQVHTQNSDYAKAIYNYKKLIELNPEKAANWINLINVYLFKQEYATALSYLTLFEKKFPQQKLIAVTLRIKALLASDQPQKALNYINVILKQDPQDPLLQSLKMTVVKRLEAHQSALKINPALAKLLKYYPLEALNAEENKQFKKALKLYQNAYADSQHKFKILLKIAELQWHLHQNNQAIHTLIKALQLNPTDNTLRLTLASWYFAMHQYHKVIKICQRILKTSANHQSALLLQARAWQSLNNRRQAINSYQLLLSKYPKNKTALIELSTILTLNAQYSKALKLLAIYKKCYGKTNIYIATKARLYATAGQAHTALMLINPLLKHYPNNLNYLYTQTLAYYYNWQPNAALKNLTTVKHKDFDELKHFINKQLNSRIHFDENYSKDTDTVAINTAMLGVRVKASPTTHGIFDLTTQHLRADSDSGLATVNGTDIHLHTLKFGMDTVLNPYFRYRLIAGVQNYTANNVLTYHVTGKIKFNDHLKINLQNQQNIYAVSPLAVSLGIKRNLSSLSLDYQPSFYYSVISDFSYATLSDGNRFWQWQFQPAIAVVTKQYVKVDTGPYVNLFSFSQTLNNGYYNPSLYQFYGWATQGFYAYSDKLGFSLSFTVGEQKDETFDRFRFASDVALQSFWKLPMNFEAITALSISNRGRSISSGNLAGDYEIYRVQLNLLKHF